MDAQIPTTPFGRRPLSLAMVASQSIAKACPAGIVVNKWQVFRAICEARDAVGVSERALAVLEALVSFHPETVLTAAHGLVVFPSNRQLALRAHGMPASTLRRHLSVLVEAGLIVRRDSPNGKRYRRADGEGEGGQAFGFDLMPLLARAAEFEAAAQSVRDERQFVTRLRERITIARRDVLKICATGADEGAPGDWETIRKVYASIVERLPRRASSPLLVGIAEELGLLRQEALMLLEHHVKSQKKNGSESTDEHHIQNSKPEAPSDLEPVRRNGLGQDDAPTFVGSGPPCRSFPLPMILQACPDIIDYARSGISSWRDLVAATDVARGALGISPSAYEDAQAAMGREGASVVVAAILQKGSSVNNAGAYLRGLTSKAREGGFSSGPMLMALLRSRIGERRLA